MPATSGARWTSCTCPRCCTTAGGCCARCTPCARCATGARRCSTATIRNSGRRCRRLRPPCCERTLGRDAQRVERDVRRAAERRPDQQRDALRSAAGLHHPRPDGEDDREHAARQGGTGHRRIRRDPFRIERQPEDGEHGDRDGEGTTRQHGAPQKKKYGATMAPTTIATCRIAMLAWPNLSCDPSSSSYSACSSG